MFKNIFTAFLIGLFSLAAMAQEETKWGYFTGTEFKGMGYGYTGDYSIGIWVPGNATLAGKTIVAMNVPCRSAHCVNVHLWGGSQLGDKSLLEQDCTATKFIQGYTRVELEKPVVIPATGMYIGYSFTIEQILDIYDENPVGCIRTDGEGGTPAEKSFYLSFSTYGGKWEDKSDIRSSALQLFLVGSQTADYILPTAASVESFVKGKEKAPMTLSLSSYSSTAVSSIGYSVEVAGVKTTGVKTFTTPLQPGLNVSAVTSIDINVPQQAGHYDASVEITSINGKPNVTTDPTILNFGFNVLTREAKRMTIIEDVTGTGCSYCPKGIAVMDQIKKLYGDNVGVITVHWFNNYSPMYVADYDQSSIPTSIAPMCMIDRKTALFDPYDGIEGKSAATWTSNLMQLLPEADIQASAYFTDDTYNSVKATATTEFLTDLPGSTIAFVLTANGLTGTTSAWKQNNSFAELDPATYPLLADYCAGGKYGMNPVALINNDVMIGSSWRAEKQDDAPAFTGSCAAGQSETLNYEIRMPSKQVLRSALKMDEIYLTAVVFTAEGAIANATRCRVDGVPEGLSSVVATESQHTATDLCGRTIKNPTRGTLVITDRKKQLVQ